MELNFEGINDSLEYISKEEKAYFERVVLDLPTEAKRLLFLLIVRSDDKYQVTVDDIGRIQYRQLISADIIQVKVREGYGYDIQIMSDHRSLVSILKREFIKEYQRIGEKGGRDVR